MVGPRLPISLSTLVVGFPQHPLRFDNPLEWLTELREPFAYIYGLFIIRDVMKATDAQLEEEAHGVRFGRGGS